MSGIDLMDSKLATEIVTQGFKTLKNDIQLALNEENGWKYKGEKNNVDIYVIKDPDYPQHCLGVCEVDLSPHFAMYVFLLRQYRPIWDDLHGEVTTLKPITDMLTIDRIRTLGVYAVAPREVVTLRARIFDIDDESKDDCWSFYQSVDNDGLEVTKGYVRARCHYGGIHFESLDNGKRCRMSYLSCVNPGGSIPKFLHKYMNQRCPLLIGNFRDFVINNPDIIERARLQYESDELEGSVHKSEDILVDDLNMNQHYDVNKRAVDLEQANVYEVNINNDANQ